MNKAQRQRVIVHTDPELIGHAVGAWLAARPDLDVVVDPAGATLRSAGARDVIVSSDPVTSPARVLVIDENGFSIVDGETVTSEAYRNLDHLYSLITQTRRPSIRGSTPKRGPKGGGST